MPDPATTPSSSVLALVQRSSLPRLVGEALEAMILAGELPPGSKLNEAALAVRFSISRGPLREALRTLEESGLIRQEKNRGAYVREIELAEAADIYDVRAGLDATAGRLLADRINAQQLAELRSFAERMQLAATNNDVDVFHKLNLGFHDRIIEMTGNTALNEAYRRLVKQLALFRRRNLLAPRAIPHFADEHSGIVDLLAAGNGAGAAEALYAHAQGGRQRMLRDGDLAAASDGV